MSIRAAFAFSLLLLASCRQQPQQEVEITVEDDVPSVEDAPVVSNDPQIDSLLAQLNQLQETMTSMQTENANTIADRDRQLAQLQAQLDAARIRTVSPVFTAAMSMSAP